MSADAPKNQPLYIPPEERVSLEELKARVNQIQDLALRRTKETVHKVYEQDTTKVALLVLGVVAIAASVAYFAGAAACRRGSEPPGLE
jgi:hypothetical protein